MNQSSEFDRSITDEVEGFQDYLNNGMTKLMGIWDEIGLKGEAIELRRLTVVTHLKNLVDEMLREEETTKANLFKNVSIFLTQLSKLCVELRHPPYQPDQEFSLLQREHDLKIKVEQLTQEKSKKLERLKALLSMDQQLCTELCSIPYYIPSGLLPTDEQLQGLEYHIHQLEAQKESRALMFKETKQNIVDLIEELGVQPVSQFEHDVIAEDENSFMLSTENMKNLQTFHERLQKRVEENREASEKLLSEIQLLWEQLNVSMEEREQFLCSNQGIKQRTIHAMREEVNRCKILKIQNASILVMGLRKQLVHIWDKCYISEEQRNVFFPFFSDEFNEELMVKHEEEIRKMKAYFEEHRVILEKVKHREDNWKKYLEFENTAKDPQRLFNKNWNLLLEEKERKVLGKEIPRLDNEVQEEISSWELSARKSFLINGVTFREHIRAQWEELSRQKNCEKQQRQQSKQKRTEEEMMFGSKPVIVTPIKKPLNVPASQERSSSKTLRAIPMGQRNIIPLHEVKQPVLDLRPEPLSETFMLSQTIVGSSEIHRLDPEVTVAPLEMYSDFEIMLNEDARSNTRSSVATRSRDSDD